MNIDISERKQLEQSSNVLLLAPLTPTGNRTCLELLASTARPEEANVAAITYTPPPETWVADWKAHKDRLPSELAFIHANTVETADEDRVEGVSPEVSVARVDPNQPMDIIAPLSEQLTRWKENGNQTLVSVQTLTILLEYVDFDTAFRYLHILTHRVQAANAIGFYHMDPDIHDEETINTLKTLFDANFAMVLASMVLFLVLVVMLTLRLRKKELETMRKIGSTGWTVFLLQATEITFVLLTGLLLATLFSAGVVAYVISTVQSVSEFEALPLTVDAHGPGGETTAWEGDALMVLVGNARRFVTGDETQAAVEDGECEVTVVEDVSTLDAVGEAVASGVFAADSEYVERFRAPNLTVTHRDSEPVRFSLDGEMLTRPSLTVTTDPGALEVAVGESYQPDPGEP